MWSRGRSESCRRASQDIEAQETLEVIIALLPESVHVSEDGHPMESGSTVDITSGCLSVSLPVSKFQVNQISTKLPSIGALTQCHGERMRLQFLMRFRDLKLMSKSASATAGRGWGAGRRLTCTKIGFLSGVAYGDSIFVDSHQ
jgi:hypothetical protein